MRRPVFELDFINMLILVIVVAVVVILAERDAESNALELSHCVLVLGEHGSFGADGA